MFLEWWRMVQEREWNRAGRSVSLPRVEMGFTISAAVRSMTPGFPVSSAHSPSQGLAFSTGRSVIPISSNVGQCTPAGGLHSCSEWYTRTLEVGAGVGHWPLEHASPFITIMADLSPQLHFPYPWLPAITSNLGFFLTKSFQ